MIRLGVLLSGSGTNLQALINAITRGELDACIDLVVSSRPDAYGLIRAQEAGIATLALSRADYDDPLAADARIVEALQQAGGHTGAEASGGGAIVGEEPTKTGVDYVVMAGYMRMVREPLLTAFPRRIINIHPALLPSFPGAHGIADAFAAGVKVTGVTVHLASERYDEGPIIAQRAVPVDEGDTLESLEKKIHAVEHVLYPQTLQLFAQERVYRAEDGKVHIRS
jgi:phosphoribosylglycinamide formyltransferase-1